MFWLILICSILLSYVIDLSVFQGVVVLLFCCCVYLTGKMLGGEKFGSIHRADGINFIRMVFNRPLR